MGPESWDHRVGRVGTRSWRWDKTVRTRELGLENWDRRVGTRELGELGPGVGARSWDQELGQDSWES